MPLIYKKTGAIAEFVIDNGRLSILTPEMHKDLFAALNDFLADPKLRVGILSGPPGNSFCAGDDIKTTLPELTPSEALSAHFNTHGHERAKGLTRPGWEQDVMRLRRLKPIIGAVDGYCLGQGIIYLLMLTDLRIATPRAEFGFPEIAYGMGGAGGITRLGRQIPHALAMEMLLLGARIPAPKALEFHLINKIVPPEGLFAEARAWAEQIAAHPPVAVQLELDAYQRALDLSREQSMDYAGTLFRFQRVAYDVPSKDTGFLGKAGDDA